jgi:hypothetical protein
MLERKATDDERTLQSSTYDVSPRARRDARDQWSRNRKMQHH